MHGRNLALLGVPLAIVVSGMSAAAPGEVSQARGHDGQTVRGPDAHLIRRSKGDVLEIREASPGRRAASPYVAPYANWRFVRLKPGQRLRPEFFTARYRVADPAGLDASRGDRHWVRYGADLVLVNIRSGNVIRVVPHRFG